MKYYSLNNNSPLVDFKEATIRGQAPDKGLYFPEAIPEVDKDLIREIEKTANDEIAFRVIKPFVGNAISESRLFEIVGETLNFPIPLVSITPDIFSLELFWGPTLAFKDIGARFMSRCLGEFIKDGHSGSNKKKLVVLVATSGDTGGAVANGFLGVENVEVIILYPKGKVSPVQEKQLTALGQNIHALEVSGTFDDCQSMVKKAFVDRDINQRLFLTSANSINVARWLPQQFYYFFAYKQWKDKREPPVISVPSGNFGNICAGLLAFISGLPVKHFISACNANDMVAKYLDSGQYIPQEAIPTYSNAMDVGDPSNFIRIMELFAGKYENIRMHLSAESISDAETVTTIGECFKNYQYLLDPHGAVGYCALKRYLNRNGGKGIFLETAHPVKFPEIVEKTVGKRIEIPGILKDLLRKEKRALELKPDFDLLKEYLMNF